jgi:ABC-2 type transport system permease protein
MRIINVWLRVSAMAAQSQLLTTWAGAFFLIGKIVRFFLFLIFLTSLTGLTGSLGGYRREQIILFYLVFYFIDLSSQFLFRGVYQFRYSVISGSYDINLLRPLPSFFVPVFGWTDILDFIVVVPLGIYLFGYILANHLFNGGLNLILFLLLLVNSLLLAFSFHLFTCAVCIVTTQIDPLVWVYRDLTSMARFPTDIYQKGVRAVLTFIIPVVILMTVPTKTLLGLLSWQWIFFSFILGITSVLGSLHCWQSALRRYSSASS